MDKGKNSLSNLIEKGKQIRYPKFILKKEKKKQVSYILRAIVIILYIVNCSSAQDKLNDEAVKNISKQTQVPPKEDVYVRDVKDGKLATTDDGERVLLKSDLTWELFDGDEFKEGKFCYKDWKLIESSMEPSDEDKKEAQEKGINSYFIISKSKKLYNLKFKAKKATDDFEKKNLLLKGGKITFDEGEKDGVRYSSELSFEGDTLIRKVSAFSLFVRGVYIRTYIKCK